MLTLMGGQAAPQQWAALTRIRQATQRQGQREAHGGGLVAMGAGRYVMQAAARQPEGRKVPVEFGKPHSPGHGARTSLPLETGMPLLKPGDMRPQRLDQRRGVIALTERGGAGASFPAPRTTMCRSHTHDSHDPDCSLFVP